jgi:hypothetical protein
MTPATNPLSVGYAAIWAALNVWKPFTTIVLPGLGTQQNAQGKGFSPATSVQAADRPMARLLEGRLVGKPYQMNSKAIQITVNYPLQLMTDLPLGIDGMNLLDTVVLQAMISYDGDNPGTLQNPGIIYKWEIQPGDIKTRDPLTKRPGWGTVYNFVLTFVMLRTTFLETVFT